MDKQKVINQFQQRFQTFLANNDEWRSESEKMRDIYNGYPANGDNGENYTWRKLDGTQKVKRTTIEPVKISLAPAYCRAVCGSLLRDRKRVAAVNMSTTTSLNSEADVMDDMFQALEEITQVDAVKYQMVTEASITGVGASVFYLDMTIKQAPFGVAMEEQKQYIFFDKGRNGNLSSDDIAWCGYADPVYKADLEEYLERNNKLDIPAACDFAPELLKYVASTDQGDIDFIYHYFWREWTQLYDVRNAFRDNKEFFLQLAQQEPLIDEAIADVVKRLNLHIEEEYFSFDKNEYNQFKEMLDNIWYILNVDSINSYEQIADFYKIPISKKEINQNNLQSLIELIVSETEYNYDDLPKIKNMPEFEVSKREGRAYYRAEFAGGRLLKMGRSFTSQCHPMNFVTAFWDSKAGHHYGLMRHLAFPQKELEKSLTSMQDYSQAAAQGGYIGIKGAGDVTKLTIDYMAQGNKKIPIPTNSEFVSYGSPDTAQANMQAVQMFLQLMPKVLGVSDAIFAEVMTGNMTSALFKQLKQQIALANAEFAFAIDRSDLIRGYIYRDIVFEMATMVEGDGAIPIKYYIGDRENLVMLSRKSLSRYYGVRLVERPANADDKREMAQMLMEAFPDQIKGAITPVILDLLPIDQQIKDTALQTLQPPQPSPEEQQMAMMQQQLQVEQMQANNRMINAQAMQLEQQSRREQSASALNEQKAIVEIDKSVADIEHKQMQTLKTEVDAAIGIAKIGMEGYNMVNNMTGRDGDDSV